MMLEGEPLAQFSQATPLAYQYECDKATIKDIPKANRPHQCLVPHRDFAHYMGGNKPWMVENPRLHMMSADKNHRYNAAITLWFTVLEQLNSELGMKLDIDKWDEAHAMKEPPLGIMAKWSDLQGDHAMLKNDAKAWA